MDFSLLMAFVCDICDNLVSNEINHPDFVSLAFQNHEVEIVPIICFAVNQESSGKTCQSAVVLILLGNSASHVNFLPSVDALCDMSFVGGVLKEINQLLLSVLLQNVSVEECDILRSDGCVDVQKGPVDFVYPKDWGLTLEIACTISDIWTHEPSIKWNKQVSRIVGSVLSVHLESSFVNSQIFLWSKDDSHFLRAINSLVLVNRICGEGSDNDFLSLANQALVNVV